MRSHHVSPFILVVLAVLLAVLGPASTFALDRWSQCEITLETANRYPYPYRDVSVTATFSGPGGPLVVHGFLYETFDLNPVANRIKGRFKVRFSPPQTGTWTYTTTSSDTGLVVTTPTDISPSCTAPGPGGAHGFLRTDPSNPYSFVWDDTTRFFMWGQTYYQAVNNARYETSATPAWKTAVDNTNVRKMNKVRVLIAPWNPYWDPATSAQTETQPFCRQPPASNPTQPTSCLQVTANGQLDHDQLDFDHWKALDAVVQYLYDKGMVAEIVIFRDGTSNVVGPISLFGTLDQDKTFLDHAIARYGAYPNVIWSLTNEWQSAKNDSSYWNTIGDCVRSGCTTSGGRAVGPDPWVIQGTFKRPLTIHPASASNQGHCFSFYGQTWPAHASLQEHKSNSTCTGFQGDVMGYNSIAANRQSVAGTCTPTSGKSLPVSNDEYGYLGLAFTTAGCVPQTRDEHRNVMWGIATAGGYGTAGDIRCDCPDSFGRCLSSSLCSVPPIQSTLWRSGNEWIDVQRIIEFFTTRSIPYWTMAGQDVYPDSDRVHTLADSGKNNLVSYFAANASVTLGLPTGTYKTVWYNPRTNVDNTLTCTVVTSSQPSFSPPDTSGDWVLWLRKSAVCP
jgi:hypothetical protein